MPHVAFYRGLERAQQALAGSPADGPDRAQQAHRLLEPELALAAPAWACRRGCAHCCRHPVGITLPEALLLRAAIVALPAAERAVVADAVTAAAAATRALPWARLGGLPCPLLHGEACRLHAARPLPCRGFGCTDATACADSAAGLPVPVPFDAGVFGLALGIGAVLGGELGHRELRAAVAAVLPCDDPVASARAFAAARRAGSEPAA